VVLREPLDELRPLLAQEGAPADVAVASLAVSVNRLATDAGPLLFPPVIRLETVDPPAGEGRRGGSAVFLWALPGVAVFSLFLLGELAMRDLLTEGRDGTLKRLLAGPVRPGAVVAGKALHAAALSLVALVLLAAIAGFASAGAVDAGGFALLALALVLAATGFGAAAHGLAASERQGSTLATVLALAMGFLGGSFVPLDSLPEGLRRAAPFSLFYWGTDGFRRLLQDGAGAGSVAGNAAVLAGAGALLLALGAALLARRIRRGVA
jgi:ABC-2 type transport system permease protein